MKPAEVAAVPDARPDDKPKLDEAVPLAGGAGAVVLALAGAGMAIRRRKRRDEEGFEEEWEDETTGEDELLLEPENEWSPPVIEPVPAAAAAQLSDLPDGFDTSNFGRHVQAAYRGPTPENPSLSLRKRLKIAGELDRREREYGAEVSAANNPAAAPEDDLQSSSFFFSRNPTEVKTLEKQY